MKSNLALLGLLALCACASPYTPPPDNHIITSNNFEGLLGWVPDAGSLSKEQVHSGSYSLRVGPEREFSLTYDAVLGELRAHMPRGVRVEAWVYLTAQSTGKLGLVVANPNDGQSLVNEGIDLSELKEFNKWVRVSKEIVFPPNVEYTHHLKCFLWRGSNTEPIYVDDLVITALK
jgi:hypothetical protein